MATAVVTGASRGIGEAIALRLITLGYEVIAISRSKTEFTDPSYTHISCDLSDEKAVTKLLAQLSPNKSISLLCNVAGFGVFEPHEQISPATITKMVALNLNAPMILSQALLPSLKQNEGIIFNITSIEALRSSKFSALYSATKSGLRAFSLALFEEVRKSGVNVISVNPDITDTSFFDTLHFGPSDAFDAKLLADDIADAIQNILQMRKGVAITELTIRSQKFGITKKR